MIHLVSADKVGIPKEQKGGNVSKIGTVVLFVVGVVITCRRRLCHAHANVKLYGVVSFAANSALLMKKYTHVNDQQSIMGTTYISKSIEHINS